MFRNSFAALGWLSICVATFFVADAHVVRATPQNSNQAINPNAPSGRSAPAPWRPSFGTIARQDSVGVGGIPPRQTFQNRGGLPAPNSPFNAPPTGTNLETGQVTQLPTTNPVRTDPFVNSNNQPATINPATNPFPQSGNTLPPRNNPAPANLNPINQAQPNPSRPFQNSSNAAPVPQTLTSGPNDNGESDRRFVDPQDQPLPAGSITRVTKSMTQLPNDAGQVWREYDISPYTSKIQGVTDPQQAILDWILKETGTEMWFNQPLGILSADLNQVRVYHTPEIQNRVHRIIDRFVNTKGQVQNLQVSLVTIKKPNWRSLAYPVMQPIEVQSPGVEAWMISKENAALLRASLERRGDFKDHGTGSIAQFDGQSVVLRNTRPVQFIRNFRWTGTQFPPYQPLMTTIDEGYTLEISSLTTLDGKTIEATVECHVDQVEKLSTVKVDVPGTVGATTDKISLQIPQLVSWRLKERFRWSNDQVLLLSCGVVATPKPNDNLPSNLPGILGNSRKRADALLFIDYRGPELEDRLPGSTARSRTVPVDRRR